ncbi:MAG: hypothetical protein M9924_03245 [Rhizobiaceae bacterium]|nr:hypothetical protein [Rhizobiaceae bacterium]
MASYFSYSRDEVIENLEAQLASLRKEVKGLRKIAAKRGAAAYEDASDGVAHIYEEIADRVVDALPTVRKSARTVERHARENPAAAAAVGLVVLGLLAAMMMRRS